VPLTRSQVRAAFTAARKHFGGKIPKGTKLARFVPGHHSTSRASPIHHSTSTTRRRVATAKKTVSRHPKLVTRGINALGLVIAFGQSVGALARTATGQESPENLPHDIVYYESGLDINTGQVNLQQTITSVELKAIGWAVTKIAKNLTKSMRM
jgi:hypothetical protein